MTYDYRRVVASKKPLYGHVSADTAYVIDDYPSGFKARCRKRVWIEFKGKTGWRLVEQTSDKWYPGEEPEKDAKLRWNKPKASTYSTMGACMYLDGQDHVQWSQLNVHDKPTKVLEFIKEFPKADFGSVKHLVSAQFRNLGNKMLGHSAIVINGEPKPWSDRDLGEAREELKVWAEIGKEVDVKTPPQIQDLIDGKVSTKQIDPEAIKTNMRLEREEADAARAEEVKKTPGAMSRKQFAEYLKSKTKLDGRTLRISEPDSYGAATIFVNFYNVPEGHGDAEAENNRQGFSVDGFDKRDADKPVANVKVSLRLDHIGRGAEGRAKSNLRGKSGPPAKIAEYLAAHISKLVKEFEPRLS